MKIKGKLRERREIKRETRWRQVEKRRMWEGRGEGERKIESRPRENPHTYVRYVGANTKLCAGICQEPVPGAHSVRQTDRQTYRTDTQSLLLLHYASLPAGPPTLTTGAIPSH